MSQAGQIRTLHCANPQCRKSFMVSGRRNSHRKYCSPLCAKDVQKKQMAEASKRYFLKKRLHPELIGLKLPRPQYHGVRSARTVYDIDSLVVLPACKAIKAIEQELTRIYGV